VIFEENRVGTFALYHNITELKRAEAAIQESERGWRILLTSCPMPRWSSITQQSDRLEPRHRGDDRGHRAGDAGKGITNTPYPSTASAARSSSTWCFYARGVEARYVQIRAQGRRWSGDLHTGPDRGARYLYATASVLHDALGNVVGAIETIRDITDRKHTEEELNLAKAAANRPTRQERLPGQHEP